MIDKDKLVKGKPIKILPNEGIFEMDDKREENNGNLTISYTGYDKDKDAWNLGYTSSFILQLSEENIQRISNHEKINDKNDFLEVVEGFKKSKKVSLKDKKVIYIDVVLVDFIFRGNKLGKSFVEDIIQYAKENDIEYVILKAHPFVTWKYGFVRQQNDKQIREERKKLQLFYQKIGFNLLKQKCDLMYLNVAK